MRRQIWSIGGGKGGIGKSLLAASLGWQLARLGKRVVLVDADLGGANLHTCLGLPGPRARSATSSCGASSASRTWSWRRRFPRLRLISGASDVLGAANIKLPAEGARPQQASAPWTWTSSCIDLGAGTSLQHHRLLPHLRRLAAGGGARADLDRERLPLHQERALPPPPQRRPQPRPCAQIIDSALDQKNAQGIRTPLDLLAAVERRTRRRWRGCAASWREFHPRFVVNQVRSTRTSRSATSSSRPVRATSAARELRGLCPLRRRGVAGGAPAAALRGEATPDSAPAQEVRQIARGLAEGETLALSW